MSTLRSTYFAIARSIFPQSFRADRENVLFPLVEIWGVGARGHNSLPGKLVCGTDRKDKNEYGRGSLKLRRYFRPNTRKPMCLDRVRCAHCHLEQHQHRFVGFGECGDGKRAHRPEIAVLGLEINADVCPIDTWGSRPFSKHATEFRHLGEILARLMACVDSNGFRST